MFELAIAQYAFKLLVALAGILIGRGALVWMDRTLVNAKRSNFTDWYENADDKSKSIYYAGRFIAVAIIIGAAIG